ncbi:LamG domain-containing protein, partial [archaeon]|nr:LamG domain-containing protein [archaeon]
TSNILEVVKSRLTTQGDEIANDPTITNEQLYKSQLIPATQYNYPNVYPSLDADATNLIAHYKFDDSNNAGLDSSSNGNNLRARDGTVEIVSTNSVFGSSSYYTSDSLETNSFTFHDKAFSISVWAYYTGAGNIITQHKNATLNQSLHCQVLTSNSSFIYRFGFFSNDLNSPEYNDSNMWVHLVYQIHLDGKREIWRNGVKIASDTSSAFLDLSGSYNVIVGDWLRPSASTRYYNGYLDDFRIYDRALTPSEIDILANLKVKTYVEPIPLLRLMENDKPKYKLLTFTYDNNLVDYPVLDADGTNLVAWYKFDGDYNDSNPSATKYNLSVSGSPELSSSISINGESLYLNAYQEFLSTSVNIPMQFNMAFSFWFKRIDNNDHDILMAIGADFFIMAHTGNMFYISNTYGGSEIYGQPSVTWNTNWNYLVFNINSNGTWQLYFNGSEIPFTTSGGTYPLTSSRLPIGKLYIGGKDVGYWDGDHDTEGYIDDFRVYDKALSAAEITDLYNQYF